MDKQAKLIAEKIEATIRQDFHPKHMQDFDPIQRALAHLMEKLADEADTYPDRDEDRAA